MNCIKYSGESLMNAEYYSLGNADAVFVSFLGVAGERRGGAWGKI
jgi:hypothetical protein